MQWGSSPTTFLFSVACSLFPTGASLPHPELPAAPPRRPPCHNFLATMSRRTRDICDRIDCITSAAELQRVLAHLQMRLESFGER